MGEALIAKKAELGHGNWLPWVRENLDFSEDTASNYMELANEWEQISNSEALRNMPVTNAVKQLRQQKKKQRPTAKQTQPPVPDEATDLTVSGVENEADEAVENEQEAEDRQEIPTESIQVVSPIGELKAGDEGITVMRDRFEDEDKAITRYSFEVDKEAIAPTQALVEFDYSLLSCDIEPMLALQAKNAQFKTRVTELEDECDDIIDKWGRKIENLKERVGELKVDGVFAEMPRDSVELWQLIAEANGKNLGAYLGWILSTDEDWQLDELIDNGVDIRGWELDPNLGVGNTRGELSKYYRRCEERFDDAQPSPEVLEDENPNVAGKAPIPPGEVPKDLSGKELSRRFGLSETTVNTRASRMKDKPDEFLKWLHAQTDPDGFTWYPPKEQGGKYYRL